MCGVYVWYVCGVCVCVRAKKERKEKGEKRSFLITFIPSFLLLCFLIWFFYKC